MFLEMMLELIFFVVEIVFLMVMLVILDCLVMILFIKEMSFVIIVVWMGVFRSWERLDMCLILLKL